tara:strand:- start:9255 stop:9908 length:654 start_codon:yes stop_codon:yes gene_type:complete
VIFVCNLRDDGSDDEVYKEAVSIVEAKNAEDDREWVICSRSNYAFSYGAWEYALINHSDGLHFSFLVEDDYVPCKEGFDNLAVNRYFSSKENRDRVIYCASSWRVNQAFNSNGLINVSIFKLRNTFSLPKPRFGKPIYKHGDLCQRLFLRKFTDKGFGVIDMAPDYVFPFFCMGLKANIPYGGPFPNKHPANSPPPCSDGEIWIQPISYEGATRNAE